MAKKDFDEYYYKVFAQYTNLLTEIDEASAEVESGMVDPSILDNFKKMLAPVKESYQAVSYMKYLLDIPAKKKKKQKYNETTPLLTEAGTWHNILKRNQSILDKIKDFDFGGKKNER